MNAGKIIIFFFAMISGYPVVGTAQTYTLDHFLNVGLSNSPLLNDYRDRLKIGALDSSLIHAAHRPQVLANGQIMVAPTYNGYGYDQAITNGGNYMAVVAVSQPLFNKNILAPQYRNIVLQHKVIGNTAKITRLDLKKNITAQYIVVFADYQQLLSNREIYQLLQAQQLILKKLVESGIYKQTDYLNLKVALQSQEISVSRLQMQYKTDVSTLNYLCGINDTATIHLAAPDIAVNSNSGGSQSVFYKQFTLDSLKIVNNKALIDTKYKPAVSWFADAGLQSSRPSTLDKNFGAGFGLNLAVPIYDGRQRRLGYQKLKIAEDTRADYASFFTRQYNQQKAMLLQQLEESEKLVKQIKDKLKASQLLIDLDKKLLNTGDLLITDYILAVNNYLNIKNNLNQTEISRYQIINQLNYWNH